MEQDYASRDRQLASGVPNPLDRPHLDPWVTTQPVLEDAAAVDTVRRFLDGGDLGAAGGDVVIDDSDTTGTVQRVVDVERVTINDLFSAGSRVAFHVTLHGPYAGGLAGVDETATGTPVDLHVAGVASVDDHGVRDLRAVSGKLGITLRLASRARSA